MKEYGQNPNKIRFIVHSEGRNHTLERYLQVFQNLSQKAIIKLRHHGIVLLNGEYARMNRTVHKGDVIELIYPPVKASPYLKPEYVPLDIIYEDTDILVVDKQAGICVHPTRSHPGNTLANGVLYHWEEKGENAFFHLVNRLDKDTSGLVLVAKHSYAAQQFFSRQQAGELKRSYRGLVLGNIYDEEGTINLPISREEGRSIRRRVSSEGVPAVTAYRVLERFKGYTLLELELKTGRTHQIRVHLSHLGYPLVGDSLYGTPREDPAKNFGLERQFLHACCLSFLHPRKQKKMRFEIQLPHGLQSITAMLRKGCKIC